MALLVVLEELTPVQRAVFMLREIFDYDYASIAEIVNKSGPHCRKIAQRAREKVNAFDEILKKFNPIDIGLSEAAFIMKIASWT